MGGRQAFRLLIVGKSGSGKSAMAWEVIWSMPHPRGLSAGSFEGRKSSIFAKGDFFSRRNVTTTFFSFEENASPLAKTLSGSPGPPRSPGRACVGVLARDLPAHREAVV